MYVEVRNKRLPLRNVHGRGSSSPGVGHFLCSVAIMVYAVWLAGALQDVAVIDDAAPDFHVYFATTSQEL